MILKGKTKDAKMSTFSSNFQTLNKTIMNPFYFLNELLMSLRKSRHCLQ